MADEIQSEYQRTIQAARAVFYGELLPEVLDAFLLEYASLIDLIARDFRRGTIGAQQAERLFASIMERLEDFALRAGAIMDEAMFEAMNLAAAAHAQAVQAVAAIAGRQVAASFAGVPAEALEGMFIRRGMGGMSQSFQTLITRSITAMADDVDDFLVSAVAEGMGAERGKVILAKRLARGDAEVLRLLDQFGGNLGKAARDATVDGEVLQRARTLLYDSRRIMVTEINTAYFEADRVSAMRSPVVDLVLWQVSGRHFSIPSSPDVCTLYHRGNYHGYGPGLFHPENLPSKPHPHCACNTIAQVRPPAEWNDPKRPVPTARRISDDSARGILEAGARSTKARGARPPAITDKYVSRQMRTADQHNQWAQQYAEEGVDA